MNRRNFLSLLSAIGLSPFFARELKAFSSPTAVPEDFLTPEQRVHSERLNNQSPISKHTMGMTAAESAVFYALEAGGWVDKYQLWGDFAVSADGYDMQYKFAFPELRLAFSVRTEPFKHGYNIVSEGGDWYPGRWNVVSFAPNLLEFFPLDKPGMKASLISVCSNHVRSAERTAPDRIKQAMLKSNKRDKHCHTGYRIKEDENGYGRHFSEVHIDQY